MGLDNYPRSYPCKSRDTAVMVEDRIDCEATQKAGGCPWKDALGEESGRVYGMFGTDCWYRGKTGMWMLETLEKAGYEPPIDFYGREEDGLTSSECLELSKWMADHAEAYGYEISKEARDPGEVDAAVHSSGGAEVFGVQRTPDDLKSDVEMYHYAVKWLKWSGENCDGIEAWW